MLFSDCSFEFCALQHQATRANDFLFTTNIHQFHSRRILQLSFIIILFFRRLYARYFGFSLSVLLVMQIWCSWNYQNHFELFKIVSYICYHSSQVP